MSGRITEYRMVRAGFPEQLAEKENRLLDEGWKLYGTPFSNADLLSKVSTFCQAMVKEVLPEGRKGRSA